MVEGDVTDPAAWDRAAVGTRLVYHVAGSFREADATEADYRRVNAEAVRLAVEACRRHGVRRLVHTSTVGIHGSINGLPATEDSPIRPDGDYEVTKAAGDAIALEEAKKPGLEIVVIRPAPVYGPGDTRLVKLFRLASSSRPMLLGDGRALYHMVHIDDLVQAFLLAGERPEAAGEAFIIAGPERPSVNELVSVIARVQGRPAPRPIHLPAAPIRLLAHGCELVFTPLGLKPPIYRRRVDFFLNNRQYDTGKAERLLGYRPAVSLESGIRQTLAWCREQRLLS